jgi:uncharacterized hydrophobic protein (TIGR00271 family)
MLHLRLISPPETVASVIDYLTTLRSVTNVVHLPRAAMKPRGDLVLCDVAREDGSVVLGELGALGLSREGSISVLNVDVALSDAARDAERYAEGSAADAVIWEQVTSQTSESAELSGSYLLFMVIATLLAAIGILTDSTILVIGAMVVGPEFGPLAGVCVALVARRPRLAMRSLLALLVGFPLGIAAAYAMTELMVWTGIAPQVFASEHPQTLFISRPDAYSAIVALLAGAAGVISLTTSKSGALIGVLISVTTIPAAGNVAVAAAYDNRQELLGALAQLGINLAMLAIAGVLTLSIQRLAFVRRFRHAIRNRRAARRQLVGKP